MFPHFFSATAISPFTKEAASLAVLIASFIPCGLRSEGGVLLVLSFASQPQFSSFNTTL